MNRVLSVLNQCVAFTDRNKGKIDPVVAVLLALVPIAQHYIGLVDNAATTIMVLLVPVLMLRSVPSVLARQWRDFWVLAPLGLFFVYKLIDHGTSFTEIAQVGLMLFYLMCMVCQSIDTKMVTAAAVRIAAFAGVCLLVQYVCNYLLGFHLQMVPTSLLLEESSPWILGAQTGHGAITGKVSSLYRPSAFFLEPSHLYLYAFPGMFLTMFSAEDRKKNMIAAILIMTGMVLSTSGMGIAVVAGALVLYFALGNEEDGSFRIRNMFRGRNMILMGTLFGLFAAALVFVPFVRNSVIRVFSNPGGSTAVEGRTERAMILLRGMTPLQWIFGVSDSTAGLGFNMPGFMATAYKYGVIGIVLSFAFYASGLFTMNMPYFWVTVILLATSFFSAHTHGTFFMLFYVLILIHGRRVSGERWILELKEIPGLIRQAAEKMKNRKR